MCIVNVSMLLRSIRGSRIAKQGHYTFAKKSSTEPHHGIIRSGSRPPNDSPATQEDMKDKQSLRAPSGKRFSQEDPTSEDFTRTLWASAGWGAGMAIVVAVMYRALFDR